MLQSILVIIAIFAAFWLLKRLFPHPAWRHGDRRRTLTAGRGEHPYRAVSIHNYTDGCPAMREIAGQRLLAGEAPILPLADCESDHCHCVYRHHIDRRRGTDRRARPSPGDQLTPLPAGVQDRRGSAGRRVGDLALAR